MNSIEDILKKTMGSMERITRISLGFIIIGLGIFFLGGKNGEWPGILVALAGLMPLTSGLLNFCPLYSIFSRKVQKKSR